MSEILADDAIAHPLNETLLQEATTIKEDREVLQQRLEKLDQSRSGVSDAVYEKVRTDYITKIKSATDRLIAIKKNLQAEVRTLQEKKTSVEANLKQHKEIIEEAELRHTLGEYTPEKLEEVKSAETQESGRLDAALQTLAGGIERHRVIFEGIGDPVPDRAPTPTPTPLPPPLPIHKEPSFPQDTARIRMDPSGTEKVIAPPLETVETKAAELLVLENGKVVQMIPITKTICIGRSPSNDIVIKEPKVSRKHAEVHATAGKYFILDLESSNGTYINGKKINEQILHPNDEIAIGNSKLVFKA